MGGVRDRRHIQPALEEGAYFFAKSLRQVLHRAKSIVPKEWRAYLIPFDS